MMLIDPHFQGAFSVVERAPIAKALTAIPASHERPRMSWVQYLENSPPVKGMRVCRGVSGNAAAGSKQDVQAKAKIT